MKKFLLVMIALVVSVASFAQVTTSALNGKVADESGNPLIGATVIAVHTPSGTEYGAATNASGYYNINGMRAGGPYTITISYIGYRTNEFSGASLPLGETYTRNVKLVESQNLDAIVITSSSDDRFDSSKTGAATNITSDDIMTMPSVSRSISDIARISPYANGMSFAGGDGRSTNFTVDGANFNNNFGLSSNLPGGGNPISLDAIEAVQVVVAPFDVRQTNFVGGGINAVTKSGTNNFEASAYTYQYNENMRGNTIDGHDLGERAIDGKQIYGATVGGPIIKDKLFFFTNFEYELRPTTVVDWKASENGVADPDNYISETSKDQMQQIKDHLIKEYNYNPGSYTDYPADETNMKILARIDWNISNDHKLALRYNYTKNMAWNPTNGTSTGAQSRLNDNRISSESMAFSNSLYSMDNIVSSFAAELNSRFSEKFANQLLATYTNIQDVRGTNSDPFPFVDIMDGYNADGSIIYEPLATFGYELYSWNNAVNNTILNIKDDVTYYAGAHKLTAGLSFESQLANNSFMRFGTGYYRYASLDDFLTGAAPESFALTHGYNGELNPTAQVRFNQAGLYLQDEWSVNNNFKLSYGVRFDNIMFNEDDVQTNNAIYAFDFGGKHIDTGIWPSSNLQVSPRVGFSWDVNGDNSLKVRGGTGIFTGRLPLVFFTNMPTNSNMVQNTQYVKDPALLDKLKGGLLTDVNDMIAALGWSSEMTPDTAVASSNMVGIAPDFKMPQVWKSSLAVDYRLPVSFPFSATAEFMYTKNINAVTIVDVNFKDPESSWETFEGADNRYVYPTDFKYNAKVNRASMLSNTSEGYGYTANVTLNATPVRDLNLMVAYTRTESKEISGMPGSQASSAWESLYSVNGPNQVELARSRYVVPDRVIGSVTYTLPYSSDYAATHVSLFYSGLSPYGNTYYYSNDMNGDGIASDLMYIPASRDEIKFAPSYNKDGSVAATAKENEEAYWAFASQDKYLTDHAGEYAEAYAARAPWVHQFDLRVAQDFMVKCGNNTNKLQLEASFMNIGNLFNSSWGVSQTNSGANYGKVLAYQGQDSEGCPTFSTNVKNGASTYSYNRNYDQCWSVQVGLRYYFK